MNRNVRQASSFLVVGVLSAAIDGGLFVLLEMSGVNPVVASVISFLSSFVFNYFGNRVMVFRARHSGTFWKYALLVGVNLLLSAGIVALGVELGMLPVVAKLLSMVVIASLNFVALRNWVFRAPAKPRTASSDHTNGG